MLYTIFFKQVVTLPRDIQTNWTGYRNDLRATLGYWNRSRSDLRATLVYWKRSRSDLRGTLGYWNRSQNDLRVALGYWSRSRNDLRVALGYWNSSQNVPRVGLQTKIWAKASSKLSIVEAKQAVMFYFLALLSNRWMYDNHSETNFPPKIKRNFQNNC